MLVKLNQFKEVIGSITLVYAAVGTFGGPDGSQRS
jgi:hypothetical protein